MNLPETKMKRILRKIKYFDEKRRAIECPPTSQFAVSPPDEIYLTQWRW
jgi:hypothetical protein